MDTEHNKVDMHHGEENIQMVIKVHKNQHYNVVIRAEIYSLFHQQVKEIRS